MENTLEHGRRLMWNAYVAGIVAYLASATVGVLDGPDWLRDTFLLLGLAALATLVIVRVRARKR